MATGIYVGVGGVTRKLTGAYVGIGGVPRKVKEIYVGVGGVPKLVWRNALTYTADLQDLNSYAEGILNGEYTIDNNHVVGKAIATDFWHSSSTSYTYMQLPLKKSVGTSAYGTFTLYNASGTSIELSFSTNDDQLSFGARNNVSYLTLSGNKLSVSDRKIEITFDYYAET